jgi:hypothetical protein
MYIFRDNVSEEGGTKSFYGKEPTHLSCVGSHAARVRPEYYT